MQAVLAPAETALPSAAALAREVAETAGVPLLASNVLRSELLELPADRFRIGFGRLRFSAGLDALERTWADPPLLPAGAK